MSEENKTIQMINNDFVAHILNSSRYIQLYGEITNQKAQNTNKMLLALDFLEEKPIYVEINSCGGSIVDGYAIIDTLSSLRSPIVTLINGYAASMGGIISVVGDKRLMTKNSWWMGHAMSGGCSDYLPYLETRIDWYKRLDKQTIATLKKYTKVTEKDIEFMQHKELWLTAKEAKRKGIIDKII